MAVVGLRRTLQLRRRVASHGYWWHSIELGDWVTTPGRKSAELLKAELECFQLPDLRGKSVLDIGAWDGYFSFAAERRGASRVVALDYHTWAADMVAKTWDPDGLPGKRGFDLVREALDSRVESVFADVLTIDPAELGQFDVVLFLGVLYHTRHPLQMLERVAAVTGGTMVLETEAFTIPGHDDAALTQFFESDELEGDASNWWSFTEPALAGMCRSSGFESVRFLEPCERRPPEPSGIARHRAIAHVYKGAAPETASGEVTSR